LGWAFGSPNIWAYRKFVNQ